MGEHKTALILIMILSFTISTISLVNASEDSWTTLKPMPTPRNAGVAVVDGKIYAIGGWFNGSYLSTNEMYDPETDTWTTKTSMNTARCYHTASVVNNKIYVIGGYNGSSLSSVEEYDPSTDTWTTKSSINTGRKQTASSFPWEECRHVHVDVSSDALLMIRSFLCMSLQMVILMVMVQYIELLK